jgi:hypothetical protein
MYDWKEELKSYFESKDTEKFSDGVAAAKLNREIENFLIKTAIPALDGLKEDLQTKNRTLHIDKDKQVIRTAVRFGDTAEFIYELRIRKVGDKACALKFVNGRESIIAPQAVKNDNSINSLGQDDIRASFVYEYIAAMG